MVRVSLSFLGFLAIFFPLFGVLFAVIWSVLFDLEASVRTVCRVPNFLPSISSAIGGFAPQRYIWRICINLQAGLRFMLAFSYYHWHLRLYMGKYHSLYKVLVRLAVVLHVVENLALITLTSVSSTDNADTHEYSFITFMVCSQVYMLLSCCLVHWTQRASAFKVTHQDRKCLRYKVMLFLFNVAVFLTSVYLYFRHERYCEPNVYSWFALGEYLTVFSNIAFHGMCCWDFKDYSFTFLPTEDIRTGAFKDR